MAKLKYKVGDEWKQIAPSKEEFDEHLAEDAPHQYGSRFEWRYNVSEDSLDLVVIE